VKFLEGIILVIVFFEHLCFAVLGVTGTEGQETKRFLGARKLDRLLVGRKDSVVSLWASRKRILGSAQDYITIDELIQTKEEVLFSDILLLIFWVYLCFKFLNLKVSLLLISSCY
jgi:hypothetical protein